MASGHRPCTQHDAVEDLARELALEPGDMVLLFVSSRSDVHRVARQAKDAFAGIMVIGCTTAGELTGNGYASGEIVAVGFRQSLFSCETVLVPDVRDFDPHTLAYRMLSAHAALEHRAPDRTAEFAIVLVDGLSLAEDLLMSAVANALGPVPVIGGSAGDEIAFREVYVIHDGRVLRNAAVVAMIRSACRMRTFRLDNLRPAAGRMVVTRADPAARLVYEINAEPAGREYARILGKDPNQLNPMTFAAHPLLVRIGDQHHVRAIQRVDENGHLSFYSAIDTGVVLTLAEAEPIVEHLERALDTFTRPETPASILGFDCVLRRVEAEQTQSVRDLSAVLGRHSVVGFNTFGEQYGAAHVNQTLTGVAFYRPETDD